MRARVKLKICQEHSRLINLYIPDSTGRVVIVQYPMELAVVGLFITLGHVLVFS